MQFEKIDLSLKTLVGVKIRTNNNNEIDPALSKIAVLAESYWGNQTSNLIKHRSHAGITYAVYTDFENQEKGEYTYFLGEEVDSLDDQDLTQLSVQNLSPGTYQQFTSEQGAIPGIVISSWKEIWSMKPTDFLGKRTFCTDFEVYDQRAADPSSAIVDICIGVE